MKAMKRVNGRFVWGLSVVGVAAVLFAGVNTLAQVAATGTIFGSVTDQRGGRVTGATVTVTNDGTGLSRSVVTDSSGDFVATPLPIGTYTTRVSMTGFATSATTGILLEVDAKVEVDTKLQVAGTTQQVVVQEAALAQLQTASSDIA